MHVSIKPSSGATVQHSSFPVDLCNTMISRRGALEWAGTLLGVAAILGGCKERVPKASEAAPPATTQSDAVTTQPSSRQAFKPDPAEGYEWIAEPAPVDSVLSGQSTVRIVFAPNSVSLPANQPDREEFLKNHNWLPGRWYVASHMSHPTQIVIPEDQRFADYRVVAFDADGKRHDATLASSWGGAEQRERPFDTRLYPYMGFRLPDGGRGVAQLGVEAIPVTKQLKLAWDAYNQAKAEGLKIPPPFMPGQPFKWDLKAIDGTELSSEKSKGRVVAIFFWASWCGGCKEAQTFLAQTAEKHKEHLQIIAVNNDEDAKNAVEKRSHMPKEWAHVHIPFGTRMGNLAVAAARGNATLPRLLVIDAKGVAVRELGADYQQVGTVVDKALANRIVTGATQPG